MQQGLFYFTRVSFKRSTLLKTRLFTPLHISFLVLLSLTLVEGILILCVGIMRQEANDWITHTLIVEREGGYLLNAVLDEEVTPQKIHNNGQLAFSNHLNHLKALVRDNRAQLQQIDKINDLHIQWQKHLSARELLSSDSKYSLAEKNLFNSLRVQIQLLLEREEILLSTRKHRLQQLDHIDIAVNIFSSLVILTAFYLNRKLLHRRVEVPLQKLINVSEEWRTGQMETRFAYPSEDEIGQLAEVLNSMAGEIHRRQESMAVRNQQLENLIYSLSHDLRTPLLATRSTIDGILKGAFGFVSDTWREIFQEYRQANEDLLKLVENLLNVSRYEAGYGVHLDSEPLDWKKIFVKTIAQIKTTVKCEFDFTYQIPQSLPTVYGDELEIQRVVQNLLDNAVRVSEPNQEIFLGIATFAEDQVKVCVCDHGPGIALQEKEQLFHRFVQGRRRGKSGLGLFLSRQIVEAHKGSIGVESSIGKGSTFWFTLPVNTEQVLSQCQGNIRSRSDV